MWLTRVKKLMRESREPYGDTCVSAGGVAITLLVAPFIVYHVIVENLAKFFSLDTGLQIALLILDTVIGIMGIAVASVVVSLLYAASYWLLCGCVRMLVKLAQIGITLQQGGKT